MKPLILNEINSDQRRETVNTQQRYQAWEQARRAALDVRGSMVWRTSKGAEYLVRSAYDKAGIRRQHSLGPRSPDTERIKAQFEQSREEAQSRFKAIDEVLVRQTAINRALGLGRVPLAAARIIRSLADAGLLGNGVRIVGTNAIYLYEAVAGVTVEAGLTATGDIDLLFDSRRSIRFVVSDDIQQRSLLNVLRRFDKSFARTGQDYRAQNAEGYIVDLIKPMRDPPWKRDIASIAEADDDLVAAEIEGLVWLENAPSFEGMAIDERGAPLRMVAPDPRVWAAHKLWLSKREGREPIKKQRDAEQARIVARIVAEHFPHLPYDAGALQMLPKAVAQQAAALFT